VRQILKTVAALVGLILLVGLAFLLEAHWEMRSINPPLPELAEIDRALAIGEPPVRIRYILTAEQRSPGRRVGHPAFVIDWADGRRFMIDTGMTPEGAVSFGKPFELLLRAEPAQGYGSVGEQLGGEKSTISGVAFTHLHGDHTGGLRSLCADNDWKISIFQTPWQAERVNYTTSAGKEDLALALCETPVKLSGGPVYPLPGYPGLVAVAAGGHTPCSTVYFAKVGDVTWILAGDLAFSRQEIVDDVPKPAVYSYLIVPESTGRLAELRKWLRGLEADGRHKLIVSHAIDEIEQSGLEKWSGS
jgi:glyoxylase-like metal-dependent hydrolase (beta-lactamase superfamily II)